MKYTCNLYYRTAENKIGQFFASYGRFVARHPWKIVIFGILVNALFGIGMVRIRHLKDMEKIYTPSKSQASRDRDKVRNLFPDLSGTNFMGIHKTDVGKYGEVIIKPNGGNVLDIEFLNEVKKLHTFLFNISTNDEKGIQVRLQDICAKRLSICSVDGDLFVENEFLNAVRAGSVAFPYFFHSTRGPIYYAQNVGGVNSSEDILLSASMLLMRVNLRTDSQYFINAANNWQVSFLSQIRRFRSNCFEITYSHSDSLAEEIEKAMDYGVMYFALTFTMMIAYACMATMTAKCDVVGQRSNLGIAGVLAAGLAIVSSFGIVCLCGVEFVSPVGVVPFLIIGIGVNDMFLLMSGIAKTDLTDDIGTRVGETMRTSGVSITITSLTDLLAFAAGSSSVFVGVKHFCIYSAAAVTFCFINQATFFLACLVINERRILENRHFAICYPVKMKSKSNETNSKCFICCCTGEAPTSQTESESYLDKLPQWLLPKVVLKTSVKIVVAVLFVCILGLSIEGITELKQGLNLKLLVPEDSYYFKYRTWLDENFPSIFPVAFVLESKLRYDDPDIQSQINAFLTTVKAEPTVDDNFEINWLDHFTKTLLNTDTKLKYEENLQAFMSNPLNANYYSNLIVDKFNEEILASRFYIMSEPIESTYAQGQFMIKMRELATQSPLPVFAFSPAFIYFEQYIIIISQTIQTVGLAILMIFLVTAIFMPHPLLLLYITITVTMITACIFGFLEFIGLTLNGMTMIQIVMSIGFSVDFAAHICHGYMISENANRNKRMEAGLKRSGAPIFHGAISSLLGVIVLAFADSYIFFSFFKLMSLVITFGSLHALLLLPVILSSFGPRFTGEHANVSIHNDEKTNRICTINNMINRKRLNSLSIKIQTDPRPEFACSKDLQDALQTQDAFKS